MQDTLKHVIKTLLETIEDNNLALYKKIIQDKKLIVKTPEEFYFTFSYPYEQFLRGYLQIEHSKNEDLQFLMLKADFIEHHFEKIIEKYEGSTCCADKSRHLLNCLYAYYKEAKPITFDYQQEYTYHLPKKVFITETSIIDFYKAIQDLYYGKIDNYLNILAKIE